jgi:hypothetical protein
MDGRRIDGLWAKKKEQMAQESDPAQMAERLPQVRVEMCEMNNTWATGPCGKNTGNFGRFSRCPRDPSGSLGKGAGRVVWNCAPKNVRLARNKKTLNRKELPHLQCLGRFAEDFQDLQGGAVDALGMTSDGGRVGMVGRIRPRNRKRARRPMWKCQSGVKWRGTLSRDDCKGISRQT